MSAAMPMEESKYKKASEMEYIVNKSIDLTSDETSTKKLLNTLNLLIESYFNKSISYKSKYTYLSVNINEEDVLINLEYPIEENTNNSKGSNSIDSNSKYQVFRIFENIIVFSDNNIYYIIHKEDNILNKFMDKIKKILKKDALKNLEILNSRILNAYNLNRLNNINSILNK